MCDEKVRPTIDSDGPQRPWILVGEIGRDQKAFIDATRKMQSARDSHARSVDFLIQIHSPQVAVAPGPKQQGATLTFEKAGLWVAVDLSPADPLDGPRYAVCTQRVRAAGVKMNPPRQKVGPDLRLLAILPVRAHARTGVGAVEWGYRGTLL